jgi:hypothetical protein
MIKSKNLKGEQAVTANYLGNGAVVFLTEDGRWSPNVNDSAIAGDAATAAALMAIANKAQSDRLVVGPYLFEVSVEGATVRPLSTREAIRAAGPTVEEREPATASLG